MAITIIGPPFSTCTQRVVTVLEELQVPYKLGSIDMAKGEHKQPAHLAKHPFGKVPVLEDSETGVTMFESRAIIRYLATKYADKATTLFGADLKQRAITDNWMEVESQNFNPPVQTIIMQRLFSSWHGKQPDEAVIAEKLKEWETVLDVYEGQLATRPYVAGKEFTIADAVHIPHLSLAITAAGVGHVLDSRPNVKAWYERITSRPSWKKANVPFPTK